MMRLIRPADWTDMPWRNGGGTTSEIAAERQDGAIVWRISTATVERDGAYSAFPGCLRISTVIEGNGTALHDEASGLTVSIPPLTPTRFDGAVPWQGRLTAGPIRHLNLIYDPRRVQAAVDVHRIEDEARLAPGTGALFCVAGCCTIGDARLEQHEMLIRPPAGATLRGPATLLRIAIAPA